MPETWTIAGSGLLECVDWTESESESDEWSELEPEDEEDPEDEEEEEGDGGDGVRGSFPWRLFFFGGERRAAESAVLAGSERLWWCPFWGRLEPRLSLARRRGGGVWADGDLRFLGSQGSLGPGERRLVSETRPELGDVL